MNIFLSLGIIVITGFLLGYLFSKIHLPKLIAYLLVGILFGPSLLNILDPTLLEISSILRQIALIIILTRSALSLDLKNLKSVGRSAILMCFLPATFEIIGVTIFGPLLLNISYLEALLLGSTLAAVSPAVVVPRMIKLKEEGLGNKHHVSELVMAGASIDDIFVIVIFYSTKTLVSKGEIDVTNILMTPVAIILGIILGILLFIIYYFLIKKIVMNDILKTILYFGFSLLMLGIENLIKPYISISSLLGIIVFGILLFKYDKKSAKEINIKYNSLWNFFEILLFSLVGASFDYKSAFSKDGLLIILLLVISLLFRSLGVIISLICTSFNKKEKLFIIISYLPKATVQASIGAIALQEGLACGNIILTACIISILLTAPLGALLMDSLKNKLLEKDDINKKIIKNE